MDPVVPVAVKAMPLEAYRRQLRIGDGDATRVLAAVEFSAESGPCASTNEATIGPSRRVGCRANSSRCANRCSLVPLARTRRKVTTVITKPVRLARPAVPTSTTGGAPRCSRLHPPCAWRDTPDPCAATNAGSTVPRARGVVIDPDTHPAFVAMQIVDARNGLPARGGGGRDHEVVDLYPCGVFAGRQVRPAFLNAPTSSFFLVSTEIVGCCCRCARRTRRAMSETARPDRHAGGPHESWRCPAGVAQSVQQLGDHRWLTRWPRPSSATANVRALWHVHRSGESGSPGAVGSTNVTPVSSRACGRRPPFRARPPSIHANRAGWSNTRQRRIPSLPVARRQCPDLQVDLIHGHDQVLVFPGSGRRGVNFRAVVPVEDVSSNSAVKSLAISPRPARNAVGVVARSSGGSVVTMTWRSSGR